MALHKIQADVLRLLAASRDPESYVAGSTPLNREAARFSGDIDIFHDRADRVAEAAVMDARILQDAGYQVEWIRQLPTLHSAEIRDGRDATKLEWAMDSDFRFFPTLQDELFGYTLHPVDLALNKVLAAAGRRELRDIIDLVTVHETILPIGALVWAAVEKSPGFTPEGLIGEIRRNLNHPAEVWRSLAIEKPLEPSAVIERIRGILDEAEQFVRQMPTEHAGFCSLKRACRCSLILNGWIHIRGTRANDAVSGRPAPISQQRCGSSTDPGPNPSGLCIGPGTRARTVEHRQTAAFAGKSEIMADQAKGF